MNDQAQQQSAQPQRPKLPTWALVVVSLAILLGIAARLLLPIPAVKWAYVYDHYDNIGMGLTARAHGLFKVYSVPQRDNPELFGEIYSRPQGRFVAFKRASPRVANYPPLGVTLFYLQSELFRRVDKSLAVNTYTSRLVMSVASVLFDVILAFAVYLVGKQLASRTAALIASALSWCFPPLLLDTSFWGQTDSWFLALAVLLIYFMLRRRWITAGITLAVACMLKPQGILLLPIAAFGALIVAPREGKLSPKAFTGRIGQGLAAAIIGVAVISAPWSIADGKQWFEKSYVANFKMYADTTLIAFNVWYLDLLVNEGESAARAIDSQSDLLGAAKQSWGRAMVILAMLVLAVLALWRYRANRPLGLVLFSAGWLFSTFILPTGVHERYIVYCIPLVILASVSLRRCWIVGLVLAMVGSAELTHNVWLRRSVASSARTARAITTRYNSIPHYRRPSPQGLQNALAKIREQDAPERAKYRPWEYLATLASLLAYAWVVFTPFVFPPGPPADSPPPFPPPPAQKTRRRRKRT